MLKLISCELAKLKRKKFIPFVILSTFLFPPPVALMMLTPRMLARYDTKAELFDDFYQFVLGYGVELLLPCVIGVIAAMLFFMERDNDTFKNLRTIPVTSTQMILAKIIVLFLFGLIFCLSTAAVTIVCGSLISEVGGLGYKLWVAVELGIFVTAGTLPLVVLVVFFSKTYIFSVLNCLFLYVAVLPIIAIAARIQNGHLIGAVVAFVYGYGGMFAAGSTTLSNIYPVTASLGLIRYRSYDPAVHWNMVVCALSMLIALLVSAIFVRTTKKSAAAKRLKKPKQVITKKGW